MTIKTFQPELQLVAAVAQRGAAAFAGNANRQAGGVAQRAANAANASGDAAG